MSLPSGSMSASNIPQGGFRDQAEAWRIELLAVSESAEQWEDEEELMIASLLAAKFANNLAPENLIGSEAQRQAQIAQIVSQTTAAFQQASSIVQEMQRANFLGLSEDSRVRNDRLRTAAIMMVADETLSERYNDATYPEKQALLEQYSQISPQMMRRAQQAGAANAALSAALQSLFPAAAARYASGMNRERQEQLMNEQMTQQAADTGARNEQAKERNAQAQQDTEKQEEDSARKQQEQSEKERKKTPITGSLPSSAGRATVSMSKRAKSTAMKLTGGAFGTLGTLWGLSEWLS